MSTQFIERPATSLPDPSFEPDGPTKRPFSSAQLRQFASDDSEAGRRISKILGMLFIYTAVAMGIVIWWTFRAVGP